jgi:acetyl-CoA acetyltransferase
MNDVVIASAARTAIGTFGGGLSTLTGAELGEVAIGKRCSEQISRGMMLMRWS